MEVNINDYKLLNQVCEKYFDLFAKEESIDSSVVSGLTRVRKARYGFYFYVLESITEVSDLSDIAELITDTEFNSTFNNDKSNDEGIDAVYISEEKKTIQLFSFKYRETFKQYQTQRKNEFLESAKFLQDIEARNYSHTTGKTKDALHRICELFYDSYDIWSIEIYFVTNDSISIDVNDANIDNFRKALQLTPKFLCLGDLSKLLTDRRESIVSELIIDKTAVMSYKEGDISSDTSYIFRLSVTDLIRITCEDPTFRRQTDIFEAEKLANTNIAYEVLSDNVRGFILKSEYNKNIKETLEKTPTKFFMYNNGITIIASDIKVTPFPNGHKSKVIIENLQVLNGGQTLRTIHKYNEDNKLAGLSNLQKAEILVRVFKVTDKELMNKIAEYTNSQNAISNRDLKSISSEQIKLEKYLGNYNILYIRKNGDSGIKDEHDYELSISMEKLGQILYAIKGNPESATNKKKQIFESEYSRLFQTDDLLSENTVSYIKSYDEFRRESKIILLKKVTEQKIFYYLYIMYRKNLTCSQIIRKFEKLMTKYEYLDSYQKNRQMLTSQFKLEVDKHFGIR